MADELELVEQRFEADMAQYLEELDRGADDARKFAVANEEASRATDSLRDHAAETAAALDEERDKALEAAAAAGVYADSMGRLHEANGRFLSDTKAAELGISDFKDDLVKTKNDVEELDRTTTSFASRLKGLFGGSGNGSGGGIGGLLSKAVGGAGGMGSIGPVPLEALPAIIPVVYALLTEVTGLVSGFAAAGAGAAAFGVLAMPAFKQVTTAYQQIGKDQKAYDDALTKTAKNTALKKLQQDYKDLDPAERGAVHGLQGLMGTYHQMAKEFEPDAFKVFNDGLKLADELLPDVTPFADTFAHSIDGLLQRAGRFADSKGFKDWLAQFHKLEGPSITAIGNGIGHVATSIGKLLTTMSAKDDVHAINIAFGALTGTINAVAYVVHKLMGDWDAYSSAFRRVRHNLSADTAAMRQDFVHAGHDIEAAWNRTVHALESDTDSFRGHWVQAGHAIEADTDAMRKDFIGFGHSVESVYNSVRHTLASDTDAMREDFVAGGHRIEAVWNSVISFFRGIPGRAESALSGLPGDLERIGVNAILGFLHGIEAEAGGVLSYVENLASRVGSIFSSILRMGSPSRLFYEHGVNTLQGYINGLKAAAPAVHATMAGIGGQIAAGGIGGAGGAAPSVHVTVPITLGAGTQGYNDPRFLQFLQQILQEAILRYTQVNPSNGLSLAGKLG